MRKHGRKFPDGGLLAPTSEGFALGIPGSEALLLFELVEN